MKYVTAVVLALALAAGACSSDTQVPPAPTVVPATITDTLTGTLSVGGTSAQPFTVVQTGRLTITLNSVDPTAAVGIGIGSPSAGGCALVNSQSPVSPGSSVVMSGIALAGNLCVSVYDIGQLTGSVTYTLTIFHS
jgi:hypothetical protein